MSHRGVRIDDDQQRGWGGSPSLVVFWDSSQNQTHTGEKQYEEEREHAMRLIGHVQDRGQTVTLMAIEQPQAEYASILEVFEKSLAHEKYVTKRIHDMYALAVKEKDYAAQNHLQWFIDEQVEEEASFTEIVETLKLIGDSPMGLFQLNAQLGKRE